MKEKRIENELRRRQKEREEKKIESAKSRDLNSN
jgi:hypothetical protein